MEHSTQTILLVEDDDVEIMKVRRAFQKIHFEYPLIIAENGVEALQMLRNQLKEEPPFVPRMILLDLNMPRMNGIEFLKELRADPELRKMVVVVLTTSNADSDVDSAYSFN